LVGCTQLFEKWEHRKPFLNGAKKGSNKRQKRARGPFFNGENGKAFNKPSHRPHGGFLNRVNGKKRINIKKTLR